MNDKRNPVGCFVCTYNKKDFVIGCVETLLQQSMEAIDVYVIDNASEDDSANALREKFGNVITVVVNPENLGGSGGFNTGLRIALEKDYQYAVLIDNDVRLDKDAIKNMYEYLERHPDVGIVGAKILQMASPNTIQDLGGSITDKLQMHGNYYGYVDQGLPEELESDYISTCTAMARVEAVRKFGLMPEDNFIYWDDVEWSKKCQLAGYKTVAISSAKVWHNHSITSGVSSFVKYYLTRNRLNFVAKYCDQEEIENTAKWAVSEMFNSVFGFYMKGNSDISQVILYAFDDFLHIKRGKCEQYKLIKISDSPIPLQKALDGKDSVAIKFMDNYMDDPLDIFHVFLFIVSHIQRHKAYKSITVDLSDCNYTEAEFRKQLNRVLDMDTVDWPVPEFVVTESKTSADVNLIMCEHVRKVKDDILPDIYVDRYCNSITCSRDALLFQSAEFMERMFHDIYDRLAIEAVREISSKRIEEYKNKNYENDGFITMKKWLENRNAGKTFADYFHDYGYKNIAIYGAGDLGRLLYEEIKDSGIKVSYFVDRNGEGILENEGIRVITVDRIKEMPLVDVIVITPVGNYDAISRALVIEAPELPTINLREAVYEF